MDRERNWVIADGVVFRKYTEMVFYRYASQGRYDLNFVKRRNI